MICGRCKQNEDKCGKCWQTAALGASMTVPRNHTLLQGLLRDGVTVAEAIEKYKLRVTRHKKHSNLVQFKYDQIDSDLNDQLVRQCRGIIMDEDDNWEIVARPFDKFFNHGEALASPIDWKTARVQEKLDGTCCVLYYYEGWQVATLGSCDASGSVGPYEMTFADLFWRTFQDVGYKVPHTMWSGVTFIFELTTPYNRVVVNHGHSDLILLGSRTPNGQEASLKDSGFRCVKDFELHNLPAIEATFEGIDPTLQEGYVVVDGNYNRIKVKHPGYVRIHHMKDSFTLRNIVDCVRNGEDIEFLNYFPEHANIVTMIKDSFFALIQECTDVWHLSCHHVEQKDFAMAVKDFPFSGVLFAVRNGKKNSITHALQEMNIDSLIDLLEVKKKVA